MFFRIGDKVKLIGKSYYYIKYGDINTVSAIDNMNYELGVKEFNNGEINYDSNDFELVERATPIIVNNISIQELELVREHILDTEFDMLPKKVQTDVFEIVRLLLEQEIDKKYSERYVKSLEEDT